jgi:hypothetical protein
MFLGALYLLIVGAGPWSLDALLARRDPDDAGSTASPATPSRRQP